MPPTGIPPFAGGPSSHRIGKYELLGHIATGGMGSVYRARDTELGREVALKVLQSALASRADVLERFRREARHCARLRHESIVTLFEFGEADGHHYLAMELVEGVNLYEYIMRNGPMAPELALRLLAQVTKALCHAHEQGIVHRDIKPSNIILTQHNNKPRAKLIDLGLALLAEEDEFKVTRDGSTVGTVDYMPPEQAQDSRAVDIRSDIYSLGCSFYHLLTGEAPFAGGGIAERIHKHAEVPPVDVRELAPRVPRWLAAVLHRMLAKKPADRYQTPHELLEALRRKTEARSRPEAEDFLGSELEPFSDDQPTVITPVSAGPPPSSRSIEVQSGLPFTTTEPHQVAARQFERAGQVLATGDHAYALPLLLACCKQEPSNLTYQRTLRQVQLELHPDTWRTRWLGWLGSLSGRLRLRTARRAEDHRRALGVGLDLLTHNPYSTWVLVQMAEAAEELEMSDLAVWLLEEAHALATSSRMLQLLAELREKRREYALAIAAWEEYLELHPNDSKARDRIKDLSARETIARGRYNEMVSPRSRRGQRPPA